MTVELATPQRGTSWPSLVSGIVKVGDENGKPFPIEKSSQIRTVISADVKPRYPNRVYKANKRVVEGKTVLWVYLKEYLSK
jgi:hypothetical protein